MSRPVAIVAPYRPDEHGELFDPSSGRAPTPAGHLTYRGGPLLTAVEVVAVYYGNAWKTATLADTATKLDRFFNAVLAGPLMTQLDEYSVPGKTIGAGSLVASRTLAGSFSKQLVQDAQVQRAIARWIKAGTIPSPTPNRLYFVYLPPGVTVRQGGQGSCAAFCGYHDHSALAGGFYYAVMPSPDCAGCLGGLASFDALTATSTHELCEAITDPIPGQGWYDDQAGEIGDICAWRFKHIGPITVQLEWSNRDGRCV